MKKLSAAQKAVLTKKAKAAARSKAAFKAWDTRREQAEARSEAARKAHQTRGELAMLLALSIAADLTK